uniref:Protein CHROMATIN REMODELING 24 n=1 Tax=Rhizophora mucronata TaxID=61149 RepID=A0A2P2IXE2_RHIMU
MEQEKVQRMGDEKQSSRRKPLSLNDRHYRFLQDLSAPPKPPLHSSSENEVKPSKVKLEGRRRLCKAVARDDDDVDVVADGIPQFSGITDFDSSPEEQRPAKETTKIKIEGRRRLCKVSSRDSGITKNEATVHNEPALSGITDFDSPLPSKTVGCSEDDPGANEIRDILNDLSGRLGLLSIDKKRAPISVDDMTDNFPELLRDEYSRKGDGSNGKRVDVPEYESAVSSFSQTSDPFNSPLDASGNVGNGVDEYEEDGGNLWDEDHESYSGSRELQKDQCRRMEEKLVPVGESFMSIVGEKVAVELQSESEGENYVNGVEKAKNILQRTKNNEPKQVHERLRSVGRSYSSKFWDDEEEIKEGNSVVLSSKRNVREAKGHSDVNKESFDLSSISAVSDDDYTDECVLEDADSIILTGPSSTYKLPGSIAKMLYPHQRAGLSWLWSLHCQGKGGILGDDMGLGKTMQVCGFLAGLFHSRLIRRVLVVTPKTLLSHWIKELSAVGLSGKTREYFGTSTKSRQFELQYVLQDKGVLLTTYDIVRTNSKSLQGDSYFFDDENDDSCTWDYMILDEGHLIKNPSTQRAKSLLQIPSAHRIIISGTPIQNNLKELWALFNFCCPNLLGDNKWFKERYELPILHGNEKNATDRQKFTGSRVAKELRERIQPYFLRRLKNEVFKEEDSTTTKLSKKNEIIVWLRLTKCQQQLYEAFLQSELVISAFDGSPLAALTILKKICDHPLLLTKRAAEDVLEGMDTILKPEEAGIAEKLAMHIADVAETTEFQEKHDNISCKISFIMSLLDNLIPEGHYVLIFSQTRKMLNLIQESLISNGYEFLRIDGTTKASDRAKIVNDFQEGMRAQIFLLTSQVGGLGLTLTKADRVIVVDPAWNPSTDNQSVDRAYRIGQTKDVLVYRLMTCGTVEEKIYRKQIFKGGLFKTATEQKEQIRYFSQQDLCELFSIPKQGFDTSLTQQQLLAEHDYDHKLNDSLEAHIRFLETKGIAGVSHHSLLFSKEAPVQVVQEEEEDMRFRRKGTTFVGNSSSHSLQDNVHGAMNAFRPKDVELNKKISSPESVGKLTESEIKERINRLSHILANKVTVSRLPDKGAKLQKQISELNLELHKMRMEKISEKEVIDLDDIDLEFQRSLKLNL